MEYVLRDRPDGMVDIVQMVPQFVGTFADRGIAEKVVKLMGLVGPAEAVGPSVPKASAQPLAIVAEAPVEALQKPEVSAGLPVEAPAPIRPKWAKNAIAQLPSVLDRPRTPALVDAPKLSDAQREAACARLLAGEKLATVAPDYGLTVNQMRGVWARYKSALQAHVAAGGQEPCSLCQKPFTPSISNPDRCARCSKES